MDLRVRDKVAVITGAGGGIGKAIALRLADEGAIVVATDLNEANAREVVAEITDSGKNGMALRVDATKEADVNGMVTKTMEVYGTIDILVNNVGGGWKSTFITKFPTQLWDRTIELNLKSTFLCSRAVAQEMMKRKEGRIINIASISGKVGESLVGAYSAGKFAVLGLTQVLAKELGRYSITVNAVCPGYVYTPGWEQLAQMLKDNIPAMADKNLEEIFRERVEPLTPLGCPQTPEDIASLTAYLASEEARNITGQAINVDGGAVMG